MKIKPFPNRQNATLALRGSDALMQRLIDAVGPCALRQDCTLSPFQTLLRAIVYQKLATHSAAAIYGRIQALFNRPSAISPEELLTLAPEKLRSAGLSNAKLASVLDLAEQSVMGSVPSLEEMSELDDETIIERISQVRGVGRWTVEMLLIYRLGRPDVLPVGDYAVRKGYQLAEDLAESPTPKMLAQIGAIWSPYRTVASWYLWRATDSVDWQQIRTQQRNCSEPGEKVT